MMSAEPARNVHWTHDPELVRLIEDMTSQRKVFTRAMARENIRGIRYRGFQVVLEHMDQVAYLITGKREILLDPPHATRGVRVD